GVSREVPAHAAPQSFRPARPVGIRESWTALPRLWPAWPNAALQRDVVDARNQRLILLVALPMAGKIAQVRASREDDVNPRNRRDPFRVFDADGRLNHNDHHHVVIGDLAVVASPERPILPVALASPAF